jgi:hypothetical protein
MMKGSPMTDELMVYLAPEDVRTSEAVGVSFARTLAGAPSAWFAAALGEQEAIIESAVRKAGYSKRRARLAASAFEAGARFEFTRIANAAQVRTHGNA